MKYIFLIFCTWPGDRVKLKKTHEIYINTAITIVLLTDVCIFFQLQILLLPIKMHEIKSYVKQDRAILLKQFLSEEEPHLPSQP